MVARRRVFSSLYAYNTQRNVAVALTFISACSLFLAMNIEQRVSLPLFVRVGMWSVVIILAIGTLGVFSIVFPRRNIGKDPSEITDVPTIFTAQQMRVTKYMLLSMLVGMTVLVALVPPYFKPASDLCRVRGTVVQCGYNKGFSMNIRQEGREWVVRVDSGLTDELPSIAVGDGITAMVDGLYAVELRRNNQVLFTYDEYKLDGRRCSKMLAVFYALCAVGVIVWLRADSRGWPITPNMDSGMTGS